MNWRLVFGGKCCVRSHSVRKAYSLNIYFWLVVSALGGINSVFIQPVQALESEKNAVVTETKIRRIRETPFPATSVKELLSQSPTNTPSLVQITEVEAVPTDQGVEVILQTPFGEQLQVTNRSSGNNYIADIPNAQLRLPIGDSFTFRSEKPVTGITEITVTNFDANTVRVSIIGETALPTIELFDSDRGLIIGAIAPVPSAQQPPAEDEPIEILVTGEQDGYRVPNASVGTRTDTPLRDIPQSIQVIPQQVLQDRQARSITEGLENTAGITSIVSPASGRDYFTIRGFETYGGFLINGIPDPQISSDGSFVNAERLEVLRGPAAALYGETGSISGTINVVTRQPLSYPFYEVSATAGSYNDYQGVIDLSGPLDDTGMLLYRLIVSYRNYNSFLDFDENTETFIAPSLALRFSQNTDLVIEGDVNILEQNGREAQPILGTVLENPNGEVSRSFNAAGPLNNEQRINGRIGYRLEHRFNNNWRLRNAFRYTFYADDNNNGEPIIFYDSLADDNRTLNRGFLIGSQFYNNFNLDTNLLGTFNTGTIEHQLLIGFSLNQNTTDLNYEFGDAQPVDIFNPVFDQTVNPTGQLSTDSFTTRGTFGVYLQDQIAIAENLKLLLGGRVDFFEETQDDRLADEETSQSDTAFSPRVGIVYQPLPPISLYASYARSFAPTIGIAAGGDTFRPERGTQYEVGIRADITDQLSANLALYDLTRSNVTTPDPNNPVFSVQTGRQRSRGVELDISGEMTPGWNIIGGYAYTDARITEDNDPTIEGNRRYSAPEHSFSLWTTYRIQDGDLQGLGFGVGVYYLGERWADNANTVELPSFFRTDAAIFYERDRFRAAVNFRNLFDVENYTSDYGSGTFVNRGAPFTVLGTVSWQF
ncbi:TonB-dependent siderophore receptor [Gloeocapsa sp. PCC 7428]|uniref:TonB-dependent siderophore receptor n=1 Tax=Gloeocapsa sp. PCC 7428 TaxID=1173026 RepID=UPI0002A5C6FC|nr:TonB-dependent siderophore receptor [Gloeocapsa sp. PCC 7428]AFZ30782.1 TonB-dependent siderophore receptor [Gloeocapsa sp. PCC 7428]